MVDEHFPGNQISKVTSVDDRTDACGCPAVHWDLAINEMAEYGEWARKTPFGSTCWVHISRIGGDLDYTELKLSGEDASASWDYISRRFNQIQFRS
jgi:hypothetical protein